MSIVRFGLPVALVLLALLPVAAAIARRRVAPRSTVVLRLAALGLLILALTAPQFAGGAGDTSVVFALDVSDSIPADQQQAGVDFIRAAADQRRPGDRVGLVTFGTAAVVEEVPSAAPRLLFAARPDAGATDIGAALRAALTALPPDGGRRIILLSDGNANRGSVADVLALARAEGVEISVVPLRPGRDADVLIEDLVTPQTVRVGERITVRIVIAATARASAHLAVAENGTIVEQRTLAVDAGRTVVTVARVAQTEGMLHYTATIIADPDDTIANNRGEALVAVQGAPLVWYVARQTGLLAGLLGGQQIRVRTLAPEALPPSSALFRGVAAVVLDDVPATALAPAQMAALQDYVGALGGGLVVVGGPHSYGVGGYTGTPLEEVLPVAMDVRHRLAIPSMAIILVIDASGSMGAFGQQIAKVELAKETAQSVIDLLGERDVIGVVAFDQEPRWLAVPTEARNREQVMEQVARVQAGGGTNMHPAIRLAYDYLRRSQAKVRHVIVLSDGQTDPGDFQGLLTRMTAEKITTSSVAIGADADEPIMRNVARWGGGRYYLARDLYSIPQILTAEALLASRAYLVEERFAPQPVRGGLVDDLPLPALRGYVATAPKPAAAVHLVSHQDDPVLAAWQYGIGRAVAFTSDAAPRWAAEWLGWEDLGRFWSRLVRWAMRDDVDGLQVAVEQRDGRALLIADVFTANGAPRDGLAVEAHVAGPGGAQTVALVQSAPGRYDRSLDATTPGAYAVTVVASAAAAAPLVGSAGFVVPYAPELKDLIADTALLAQIAEATGGRIGPDPRTAMAPSRAARAMNDAWPLAAGTALALFVAEIVLRRVPAIGHHLAALAAAVRARLGREPTPQEQEEDRQYAEADRWKFVEPDAAASASMEQAARLYIARLKATDKETGREPGNRGTREADDSRTQERDD